MKNVFLKKIILVNWKGVRKLEIDFSKITNILGDNAAGKSRIYDAFLWLVSGKDQFDRNNFEIISIENGKTLERVDAEVSAIFEIDGKETALTRILQQVWSRKRGEQIERLRRHETSYYLNGDPVKAGEYKTIVNSIIDETLFKLITNPAYFLFAKEMTWQKQRDYLFQMAGTITDEEIAATNPKFKQFLDSISGKTFDEHRRSINNKKKKLKEDLDEIAPRIDQTQKLMPQAKDFAPIKAELQGVENKIKATETAILDKTAAIRAQYEAIQKQQNTINQYRLEQQTAVFEAKEAAQKSVFEKNKKRRESEEALSLAQSKLTSEQRIKAEHQHTISTLETQIQTVENELVNLRQTYKDENAKTYDIKEGCLMCPVFNGPCGDPAAAIHHAEAQTKAKYEFNKAKRTNLQTKQNEGVAKVEKLERIKNNLGTKQDELAKSEAKIKALETESKSLQTKLNESPAVVTAEPVKDEELKEWQAIEEKIKTIQTKIDAIAPVDTEELIEQKKNLETRRDELKSSLSDEALIEKYNKEIKALETESGAIAQQIANLEKDLFLMEDFSKVRIKECEQRVNKLFTVVNFQLFDTTIENRDDEDKTFEVCIARNKEGVPIAATNTAERINAGLDIINTLCQFHTIKAPIFIDNRESINDLIDTESQIVNLRVLPRKYECTLCGNVQSRNDICEDEVCGGTEFRDETPKGLQIEQIGCLLAAI